jgi:acyl-coenzyme A synthetase/AMP-(fatty) acid ligase
MIVLLTNHMEFPILKWFTGGKCNIISNAIDSHVNKIAYIFENAKGTTRRVSYKKLA